MNVCSEETVVGEFEVRYPINTREAKVQSISKRLTFRNSKVPGSSHGGVTDDFSFFRIWLASVEFRREKSSTRHVASNFLIHLL